MRKFDFIVIGSRSGLEVSPGLSHAAWSVAIVEEGPLWWLLPKPRPYIIQDADPLRQHDVDSKKRRCLRYPRQS